MLIFRSNIGANLQDAKTASFLCFRHYRHHISYFLRRICWVWGPYFAIRGEGGTGICDIDMFWAPRSAFKSLIYFIVQTLLLIHNLKAVSCFKRVL
jgi:hypothetical protein